MNSYYGKNAIYQLSETANRTYFTGRAWSSEVEPPLYIASGQSYISYGKNFQVMMALRDLIGEETINGILKKITDRYRNDVEFSATTLEFLDELYQVAPPEYHRLVDDWLKRVITYQLAVADVSHRSLNDGRHEITLKVKAKRQETTADGREVEIEINEPIPIGLFAQHPGQIGLDGGIIYLQAHTIDRNGQEITLVVDQLPRYVSIDPFGTRSDENLTDNTVRVE
jgi:hypothetical protein